MESQAARAEAFKSLHARPGIFAIPNPWDAGSAKMLAALGFEALATTSAGFAYSIGRPDGEGSIEDATGRADDPIYPHALSVERVKAAVKAARSLPFPFVLTARAENLIHGRPDLPDTIRRLVAFADAGADVLYAPGLKTREEIDAVVRAVAPKPVNVVMGLSGPSLALDALAVLGVKRVSLGSSLARAAYGAVLEAGRE